MNPLDEEDFNDLADDVLGRSEFAEVRPGPVRRAVDRVIEEIGDFLDAIFGAFGGGDAGVGSAVAWVLLIVIAAVFVYAVSKLIRGRQKKEPKVESEPTLVFDEPIDPAVLEAELAEALRAQDWNAAIVASFRMTVLEMIELGFVNRSPGLTTGTIGSRLEISNPHLLPVYRQAAGAFERARYSTQRSDSSDFALVETLQTQLKVGVS